MSWFVPESDVAELRFASGALRMMSFFGMVIGFFAVFRLSKRNRAEQTATGLYTDQVRQGLSITLKCSWFWQSLFYVRKPIVEIDGTAYPTAWGHFEVPLEAGQYKLRVYFPYIAKPECGVATADIVVDTDKVLHGTYSPPHTVFQAGKLVIS